MRTFLAATALLAVTGTGSLACDEGISDENLQVGPPLTEQQIIAMLEQASGPVAEAEQADQPVRQAALVAD